MGLKLPYALESVLVSRGQPASTEDLGKLEERLRATLPEDLAEAICALAHCQIQDHELRFGDIRVDLSFGLDPETTTHIHRGDDLLWELCWMGTTKEKFEHLEASRFPWVHIGTTAVDDHIVVAAGGALDGHVVVWDRPHGDAKVVAKSVQEFLAALTVQYQEPHVPDAFALPEMTEEKKARFREVRNLLRENANITFEDDEKLTRGGFGRLEILVDRTLETNPELTTPTAICRLLRKHRFYMDEQCLEVVSAHLSARCRPLGKALATKARVVHAKFGGGVVEEAVDSNKWKVRFDNGDVKLLSPRFLRDES